MTPRQIRLAIGAGILLVAVGAGWFVRHTLAENAELVRAAKAHTRAITALTGRAEQLEQIMAENQTYDDGVRDQATRGVASNESARRSNPDVIQIDRPWPAAMRGRVFDDPDPASGSTTPAGAAPAGAGRGQVPVP